MTYKPYTLNDVKESSSKKLFSVISLFAGGGGSSIGYRLAGGNILAINEFVESAWQTYKANFPETVVLDGDIKQLSADDFIKATGIKPGELDILDGSPPCSAFSVAGKRDKNWKGAKNKVYKKVAFGDLDIDIEEELEDNDGVKKYSDGKIVEGIEDLFLEFIRIAKDLQPKVIIAENVKGITFGEAKKKLAEFMSNFERIGYQVTFKVLNAADYGTPQARERTIFICVRNDVCDVLGLEFYNLPSLFPVPTTNPHVSLKEGIHDVMNDPEEEKELYDHVQNGFQKKWIEMLPFNPSRHMKPSDPEFIKVNPKRSFFNMIRPNPNLPSPTITQAGNQKGVSGVFHYEKNRKFTTPELKRIMSFPEDYTLLGDFNKRAERLGRAVAPKMMASVAESVYNKVIKPYNEKVSQ